MLLKRKGDGDIVLAATNWTFAPHLLICRLKYLIAIVLIDIALKENRYVNKR